MQQVVSPPVFLFDGDCAFCSSSARWLQEHIPTPVTVVPWQWTDLEPLGVEVEEVDVAVVMVAPSRQHTAGPEAISDLLLTSPSRLWRTAGRLLGLKATLWVAWPIYRWISRNRHRMPGGTAQCSLPQAQRVPTDQPAP